MIVVDASAIVALLLSLEGSDEVTDRISGAGQSLHAPDLLGAEVAQVLRRYSLTGDLDDARGRDALVDFADLGIERYGHEPFLPRVWELRHNLTAYDALYVALAEALDVPVLTMDGRLATSPGHTARIDLVQVRSG